MVTDLFTLFMSEPNTLPSDWQFYGEQALRDMTKTDRARIIADYIAFHDRPLRHYRTRTVIRPWPHFEIDTFTRQRND